VQPKVAVESAVVEQATGKAPVTPLGQAETTYLQVGRHVGQGMEHGAYYQGWPTSWRQPATIDMHYSANNACDTLP
jgi:hypothetical protein